MYAHIHIITHVYQSYIYIYTCGIVLYNFTDDTSTIDSPQQHYGPIISNFLLKPVHLSVKIWTVRFQKNIVRFFRTCKHINIISYCKHEVEWVCSQSKTCKMRYEKQQKFQKTYHECSTQIYTLLHFFVSLGCMMLHLSHLHRVSVRLCQWIFLGNASWTFIFQE